MIVGAGLAGLRTAEELRRAGFDGELVLVGAETCLPYDRPPLSKEFLRGDVDDTTLRPREFFDDERIDLRLGAVATGIDPERRTVTLTAASDPDTFEELEYGELVVATGLTPRRIPGLPESEGIHVLRSVDDARGLRTRLVPGARALVVGAGFVGCELAASMRSADVDVVLVEPRSTSLEAALGPTVGALVARLHAEAGVDLRTGVGLAGVASVSGAYRATLGDGSEIVADLIVVGIGSTPVTDWLHGSGVALDTDGGVRCDESGRTGVEHVWAVGDVASWTGEAGVAERVEHWSNCGEQARSLAGALTGSGGEDTAQVRYFWSDQYGVKIQALGSVAETDRVHVVVDDGRKFVAYYERDGRLTGVVGAGKAGAVMKMRGKIAESVPIGDVLEVAST
ncbi:oxidoreductase [Rhodococcus triatomae]|nr:oxidoreductase [Rhodococcus triatomae]QNG25817.1 oxidoreductase [Rhodococcus triatomae]